MAKGGPARGGKGHITGPCLDTNVSSMSTCTWRPSGERAREISKKKWIKRRGTDITAENKGGLKVELNNVKTVFWDGVLRQWTSNDSWFKEGWTERWDSAEHKLCLCIAHVCAVSKGIRTCQNMTKATYSHRTTTKPFLWLTLLNVMFFEHLWILVDPT